MQLSEVNDFSSGLQGVHFDSGDLDSGSGRRGVVAHEEETRIAD